MTDKYKILFYGEIIEGQNLETVKKNLGILFKMDANKIDGLFSNLPILIKKDIDSPTALKYKEILKKAGARCKVEPMISEQKAAPVSTMPDENKSKYEVIFYGEFAEGEDPITVKKRLAGLFRTDISKIDKFLSHLPAVIKKNVDLEIASQYREALKKAGAICMIKPFIPTQKTMPVSEKSEKIIAPAPVSPSLTQTGKAPPVPRPIINQQSSQELNTSQETRPEISHLSESEDKVSYPSGENDPEEIQTSSETVPPSDHSANSQCDVERESSKLNVIMNKNKEVDDRMQSDRKTIHKKGLATIWKVLIGFGIACIIFILALLAAVGFFFNEAALEFKKTDKEVSYNSPHIKEDGSKSSEIKMTKSNISPSSETSLNEILKERYTSSELENLTYLDLSFTQVSDLSSIKDLENLTSLNLSWTPVSDLSPLRDLKKLSSINLSFTQVNDLTPLKDHPNLSLDLSNCQIRDLSFLKNLKYLNALILNFTQVSDLNPLQDIKTLSSLDLWNTPVSDLSPLEGLENLSSLNLWKTLVNDLSPLKNLRKLSKLNLRNTLVSDLTPLKDLENLTFLDLSHTLVSDLNPLKNSENLSSLQLWATPVYDLSPLEDLENLSKLYLWSTHVNDLSPLKSLKKLSYLDLSNNQVSEEQLIDIKKAIPGIEIKLHDSRMEEIMNRFSSNKNIAKNSSLF